MSSALSASAHVCTHRSDVPGEVDLATLERMLGDSTLEVKRIVINSYGSPSGAYDNNAKATRKQSDKLRRRLVNRYHVPESKITILNVAEDWSGLENLINNSEVVLQNRDGVLRIVKDNSLSPDEKEEMLKKNYKEDWKYLEKHFFNKLERVSFTLDYNQPDYDIIYRDGYEYRIERTKQEPCASQSNECQKVQNGSCEAARTPISDTKYTDASMTFLVDKAEIPAVFNGNQQNLDQITVKLNSLISDSAVSLQRIIVSGYASPDGLFKKNAKLALNRTNLLKNYIANRYNVPDSLLETHAVAEDWEGLEQAVLKTPDSDLPNKQAILNIIRSNYAPDVKERKIKAFKADFAYLKESILPKLRRFEYCIQYIKDGEVTNTTVVAQIEPDTAMPLIDDRTKRELLADASQEQPVVATTTDALSTDENEPLPAPTDAANAAQFVESQKVRDDRSSNSESLITDTIQADALVAFLINEAEMRADVDGNKEYLEQISSQLDQVINDTTIRLQRIIVSGYASPDGPYQKNAKLAQSRTDILKDFIVNRSNISNSLLETHAVPEDWDGLEQAVLNTPDSDLPHKQAILGIIGSSEKLDVKERKIRALRTDFNYLKENVLPKLRRSEYYIQYFKDTRLINTTVIEEEQPDTVTAVEEQPAKKKPFYIAAKTNLLYDAALVPNIGVELYLGKQWTVSADWFYNWWYSDSRHYYWQGYGGYLGVRKYFGSKSEENPFTGHHVGLYGLMMTYDVEWGNRGYQMPDWGFGGGLEYGYSMPIARRLNLDFSLGIGYQDGTYKEYLPLDGHYVWQSTHKRHWIGPTKAEISLKWLIGRGNYHKNYGKNTVI
jgi:outer membrane protein OmpA-like peptidoglycan-associated protein